MNIKIMINLIMLLTIMNCSVINSSTPEPELRNFDELWDYDNPALTEIKFLDILANLEFEHPPPPSPTKTVALLNML